MPFKKSKGAPRREASIDDVSLNLLLVLLVTVILMVSILVSYLAITMQARADLPEQDTDQGEDTPSADADYPFKVDGIEINIPTSSEAISTIKADLINSTNAVLVDLTDNEIVASRQGGQVIYPASMTKVMTLIVVAENIKSNEELDRVLTIKIPRGEHSGYGFELGEKLTVRDLIYAAILQSDGVACITLAEYIAGSEASFVALMNEKARELGLDEKSTLFQNCTGLHHAYHYSTCRDMAVIMAYAMKNPFCANVLTTLKYTPSDNFRPGDGCTFWHALLHNRLSDGNKQPNTAEIIGGKTGWTGKDSGYCVVTYAKGKDGHYYISVSAKAESWDACVQDSINIFNEYAK